MKPGKLCVIGQGSHGPYHNLQCREDGKTRTHYVPAESVAVVAEHTSNYQQFQTFDGGICGAGDRPDPCRAGGRG